MSHNRDAIVAELLDREKLRPMDSLSRDCNDMKQKYDECFNKWFTTKFLKGETSEEMCAPLFKVYQDCLQNAIKAQKLDVNLINKRVLGTETEAEKPENV